MEPQFWPMHQGDGYLQTTWTSSPCPPLPVLSQGFAWVSPRGKKFCLPERKWQEPAAAKEARLLTFPAAAGPVYDAFSFGSSGPVCRGNWLG
jgi:hypothetical protein